MRTSFASVQPVKFRVPVLCSNHLLRRLMPCAAAPFSDANLAATRPRRHRRSPLFRFPPPAPSPRRRRRRCLPRRHVRGLEIPKPTASGSFVNRRTRRARSGRSSGERFARAGHARARNQIQESTGKFGDFARRASVEVGAARKIVSSPCACIDRAIIAGFFGRQIGCQHAVGARCCRGVGEFLQAHLQDRIEIAEEHQRHVACAVRSRADKIDHARERGPAAQRAFARALNRRAHRRRGSLNGTPSSITSAPASAAAKTIFSLAVERRIARGDIGDQAQFAGLGKLAKRRGDSPCGLPRRSAGLAATRDLGMAASDIAREGFHVFVAAAGNIQDDDFVFLHLGARRISSATACADSSAGMMPSICARVRAASMAASSLTAVYSARP